MSPNEALLTPWASVRNVNIHSVGQNYMNMMRLLGKWSPRSGSLASGTLRSSLYSSGCLIHIQRGKYLNRYNWEYFSPEYCKVWKAEHYFCRWKPLENAEVLGIASQDKVLKHRVIDFEKRTLLLYLSHFMSFACWGFFVSQKVASQLKCLIANTLAKSFKMKILWTWHS